MKLSEYRRIANEYTSKASEITRQLSLAGVAIVWLFKNTATDVALIDPYLIIPLLALTSALLFDLFQYVIGGYIWITFFREEEKKISEQNHDPDVKDSENRSGLIYFFYYGKISLMIFSYVFIVVYLIGRF